LSATASGVFSGGGALTSLAACCRAPGPACAARRARDADRPTRHECAIAGPAVYPINAPATAPTGPNTTAPDTAPKAASPARFCALASNEMNDATTSAATSSFFITVPLRAPPRHRTAKLRRHKGDVTAASVRFKKPAAGFPARAQFLR